MDNTIKLRNASDRNINWDVKDMELYSDLNATHALDKKRIKNTLENDNVIKYQDESDRLGFIVNKNLLPLPVRNAGNFSIKSPDRMAHEALRNKHWAETQASTNNNLQLEVSHKLREMMKNSNPIKEVTLEEPPTMKDENTPSNKWIINNGLRDYLYQ